MSDAAALDLQGLSKKMRDIDFTMLFTRTDGGAIAGRPMSNNGDVEFDGDSWFFTYEQSRTVADIARDPAVSMSLQTSKGLLGKPPMFIAIEGSAELIRDKATFEAHWNPDLERWFENGIDTPGIVLIKVHAARIHYWDGEDDGEILV
jgi:general stress protein 26